MVTSNAVAWPPAALIQLTICCRCWSWQYAATPCSYCRESQYSPTTKCGPVRSQYSFTNCPARRVASTVGRGWRVRGGGGGGLPRPQAVLTWKRANMAGFHGGSCMDSLRHNTYATCPAGAQQSDYDKPAPAAEVGRPASARTVPRVPWITSQQRDGQTRTMQDQEEHSAKRHHAVDHGRSRRRQG